MLWSCHTKCWCSHGRQLPVYGIFTVQGFVWPNYQIQVSRKLSLVLLTPILISFSQRTSQIPEVYIWFVFRYLVEGLIVMHSGRFPDVVLQQLIEREILMSDLLDENNVLKPLDEYEPVYHFDLKDLNIVLAEPQDPYPNFQVPKIIDFGHALKLENINWVNENKKHRPRSGTDGFRGPVRSTMLPVTCANDVR